MLKNFRRKTHFWKSQAELAVKQLSGFHYQRNLASKFTRIESPGILCQGKYSKSITGTARNRRYRQTQGNAANGSQMVR